MLRTDAPHPDLPEGASPLPPPLKWAGGKRWLIPRLRSLWKPYRNHRLVEPFCGGLGVVLGLLPKLALLNDINTHLINFYQWLHKGLCISLTMKNDEKLFYSHRLRFNQLLRMGKADSKGTAELFYYLNRTGYNGLCRFNRKGEFNVPFGRYDRINYKQDFSAYQNVFKNWEFTSTDFENLKVNRSDFLYADPPYDVEFTQYSKERFGWEDQVRLARWLAKQACPAVISNQATDRIIKLYQDLGFHISLLKAPRRISCNGNRESATEVIAAKGL